MKIQPGTILISTPALDGSNFQKSVVVITQHNDKGSVGFIVNQLFGRTLQDLDEFKNCRPFPLYSGGPVEVESLFFIHQRPDLIEDGELLFDSFHFGGNFKEAVSLLNNKRISEKEIKLFVGYCGWDDGQLEAEVEEGSFVLRETAFPLLLADDNTMKWKELYAGNL